MYFENSTTQADEERQKVLHGEAYMWNIEDETRQYSRKAQRTNNNGGQETAVIKKDSKQ